MCYIEYSTWISVNMTMIQKVERIDSERLLPE